MQILGLVFAGTATPQHVAMSEFARTTLGLQPAVGTHGDESGSGGQPDAPGRLAGAVEPQVADEPVTEFFDLPNGTRFAVAGEREHGRGTSRTIGFLIGDLDEGVGELRAAGIRVDDPIEADPQRYAHFIAPDGELYELVEQLRADRPRQPGD